MPQASNGMLRANVRPQSIFTCSFLVCLFALNGEAATDWPQFLGPNRNGSCPGDQLAGSWPKEGPPIVWKRKVGQGFSGPVVAQQKLILFHRVADKEIVEALEPATGKQLWLQSYPTRYRDSFGFDEGPRATPAVTADRIYTFGAEGALHCWALDTGKPIWEVDTQKEFKPPRGFFGRACSPLVEGNAVVINVGGGEHAGIVAFDRQTGKVLWKNSDDEPSYSSPVAATVAGNRRLFVVTRGTLTVLDPANGAIDFQFPWRPRISSSVSAATPLVIGDLIFLSASYDTGALLLRYHSPKPETVWQADDVLSNHYATSVHHAGFLYGFDGRQEYGCELRCVELKTGKVRWSESGLKAGTITLAGDQLLVLTERGELL